MCWKLIFFISFICHSLSRCCIYVLLYVLCIFLLIPEPFLFCIPFVWLKLLMKIIFEELHDQGDAERMHIPIVDSLQTNQRLHTMRRYCWIRARKIDEDLKQNSICFIL